MTRGAVTPVRHSYEACTDTLHTINLNRLRPLSPILVLAALAAIGIFGQFVVVDPEQDLVVAMWSAQPKPVGREGVDEYAFLATVSAYFEEGGN